MTAIDMFFRDDAGAITIDWTALTAGILLLGIMIVYAIFGNGVDGLVDSISETLAEVNTDVDVGFAPALYDLATSDGAALPAGSTLIDNGDGQYIDAQIQATDALGNPLFGPAGDPVMISGQQWVPGSGQSTWETPSGSVVSTTDFVGMAVGTTVNSGNSLNTIGGTVASGSCTSAYSCGSSGFQGNFIPN